MFSLREKRCCALKDTNTKNKDHLSMVFIFWLREPDLNQYRAALLLDLLRCPTFSRASVHTLASVDRSASFCSLHHPPGALATSPREPLVVGSKSNSIIKNENTHHKGECFLFWLREPDLNQQPSGYEPDELPDCSIPRYIC